jgi:deoxyribonuclease-1
MLCVLLCWNAHAATITPFQPFDWKRTLESEAVGAALKEITASEVRSATSNKHSFHGITPFRMLLGDKRVTFHARVVYVGKSKTLFSESFVTWYDDCEFSKNKQCGQHWSLYYPDTAAISKARPGNLLLVARIADDELLLLIIPKSSAEARWIKEKYASDTRLKKLPAPRPILPNVASLPQSFTQAKKILSNQIYTNDNERQTFYCGCSYSTTGQIDPISCGYVPRRSGSKRATRLEWEHIVPASYIGKGRACWEQGHSECVSSTGKEYKGRRCCDKVDPEYRAISSDLNNLVPEIGELNADRSDFPYSEIDGEERLYGLCDFEVDTKLKEAEPAVPLRGFIARTWLYMNSTYNIPLSDEELKIYKTWSEAYPAQEWEIRRTEKIKHAIRAH